MIRTALVFLLVASPAAAQILGAPPTGSSTPAVWVSGTIGLAQVQPVDDGRTGAIWDFGTGVQYRVSAEVDITTGASVGLALGRARMPLRYSAFLSPSAPPPCNLDCDAHANISTAMLVFRAADEVGFHQVIEIAGGFARYENFTEDATGNVLPPITDTDLAFSLSFGFAYAFKRWGHAFIVQDGLIAIHQRDNLPGNRGSTSQHYYTRLGLRLGAGKRR